MIFKIYIVITIFVVTRCHEFLWDTPLGTLKGVETTTAFQNKSYYSFRSIPYVEPVTGIHKFEISQPVKPWNIILDATKPSTECVYYCQVRKEYVGDENCLFINVYTPRIFRTSNKAVLVWIHGGEYNYLSSDDGILGPDFLVEKDIILVTFNYRLGAIGFLNTLDESAPGNVGLKDQVMALKWVKNYIKYFGGDPNKITLGGINSGAAAVQLHMISPMSQGLFHGAIAQSGTCLNPRLMQHKPKEMAFKLGEVLGIKSNNTKELIDFLKTFTAKELTTAAEKIQNTTNLINGNLPFLPSIEENIGQDRFLTADPWNLITSGNITDVPLIVGMNLNEEFNIRHAQQLKVLNNSFEYFISNNLNLTKVEKKEFSKLLKNLYFDEKELTESTIEEFTKLLTDIILTSGIHFSAKLISNLIKSPVYKYLLTYCPSVDLSVKDNSSEPISVTHGDEAKYIFYSNVFENIPVKKSVEEKIMHAFTSMWSNFVKRGNPTATQNRYVASQWLAVGQTDYYLEINEDFNMKTDFFKERMRLWALISKNLLGEFTAHLLSL